jgi:hypothetical protein
MLTAQQLRNGGGVKLGDTLLQVSKTCQTTGSDLHCPAMCAGRLCFTRTVIASVVWQRGCMHVSLVDAPRESWQVNTNPQLGDHSHGLSYPSCRSHAPLIVSYLELTVGDVTRTHVQRTKSHSLLACEVGVCSFFLHACIATTVYTSVRCPRTQYKPP